jgi:hypothetical protein
VHETDRVYLVTCTTQRFIFSPRTATPRQILCGRIFCPYRRHLIFRGKNTTNLLSHPIVTPLMLVTTHYHPRSLPHPNEIDEIEGSWPQEELPGAIDEAGDRDDLMGGSQAGLYSSDEGEEHNLVWWAGGMGPILIVSKKKSGIKKKATILNSTTSLKVR